MVKEEMQKKWNSDYNIYYKNFLYISSIGYFITVKLLIC